MIGTLKDKEVVYTLEIRLTPDEAWSLFRIMRYNDGDSNEAMLDGVSDSIREMLYYSIPEVKQFCEEEREEMISCAEQLNQTSSQSSKHLQVSAM